MTAGVSDTSTKLHISLLGPLDIRIEGRRIGPIRSRKEQWLIALLVLRNDRYVTREWLAETLWPDNSINQSLGYLRRAVYLLRQVLESDAGRLCGEGSRTLRFAQAGANIDLVEFDSAVKRGGADDLRLAVDLYRGPLLEGCDEEWVQADRQVREQCYVTALEQLAVHERNAANFPAEIACLQRLILIDPFRESAHRSLMQAFSDNGNLSAMITAYRDLRLMLRRELNADPDASTTALYDLLRSEQRTITSRSAAASSTLKEASPSASIAVALDYPGSVQYTRKLLPIPLTRLIGREQEIVDVITAIEESRLVTLTGAGGVGKTRLAIHIASTMEDRFQDGVCYVDLSGITDSQHIAQSIAISLGHSEIADSSIVNTLVDYLSSKELLLVMDGCEHLIQGSAEVANKLLPACPALKILATSQQPIGLIGESVWRTPTLSLPPLQGKNSEKLTADDAIGFAGIALFVERAATRRSDFILTDRNLAAVLQVCNRLDGIPLAIELAAARMTVLSVDQIAGKLDDRFKLLTSGSRTAVPRHQTLVAALDWSYDLLDDAEQRMLQRLSIFAGGAVIETVEALCDDDAELAASALDLVQQLADKSFVWSAPVGGSTRYRLLETTREYVLVKLKESGDMDVFRQRHCAVYLDQLDSAWSKLIGLQAKQGWDWLEAEADNIRGLLEWLIRADASDSEIRRCQTIINTRLAALWQGRIHLGEAKYWTDRVLSRDSTRTIERASLEVTAGYVALRQGEFLLADEYLNSSLSEFRKLEYQPGIMRVLNALGKLADRQGNYEKAREIYLECLAGFESIGDASGLRAVMNNLGNVSMMAGDYASARFYHEQCLSNARKENYVTAVGWCLDNLAEVCQAEGDLLNARKLFKESLVNFVESDYRPGVEDCIQGLAEVACTGPNDELGARIAARLLGAADRMREHSGSALVPVDLPIHEQTKLLVHQVIGITVFEEEWACGRALTYDEAILAAKSYG